MRTISLLCLVSLVLAAESTSTVERDTIILSDGSITPRITLTNHALRVAVIPALGGKISSLRDASEREYLSRSGKPYTARTAEMAYGTSEFDGLDECFPTVGACDYPAAPWAGVAVPDHGELWTQAWKEIPGPGLTLEARGIQFPYTFRRSVSLTDTSVILDYQVRNDGDAPLLYLYACHALVAGDTGCGLQWPDDQPIELSYSYKQVLGASGTTLPWNALRVADQPFRDQQFVRDSGRYYKYFATPLRTGHAVAALADRATITFSWDVAALPHLAVWCSEGNVGHHLGVEPTTAAVDTLAQAAALSQARTLAAHTSVTWHITLTPQAPKNAK